MKKLIPVFFLFINITAKTYAQAPECQWLKGGGSRNNDASNVITTDKEGNYYLGGGAGGDTLFFENKHLLIRGREEIFIAKYSNDGHILWARKAKGSELDLLTDMSVDGAGNLYATGLFYSDSLSFGDITIVNKEFQTHTQELFVAKYDKDGNVLWAKSIGGVGATQANGIAVDENGNLYLTGSFKDSAVFFDKFRLATTGSKINGDCFVARLDKNGNVVWASSIGSTANDYGSAIGLDAKGHVYVSGAFGADILSLPHDTLLNAGSYDVFIIKFDTSGNFIWAKGGGGATDDYIYGMAVDREGNTFITGSFGSKTFTLGSTSIKKWTNDKDLFLAKFDPEGNVKWLQGMGGSDDEASMAVAVDRGQNVYITGSFESSPMTFGDKTFITLTKQLNFFIVKFDSSGRFLWVKTADKSFGETLGTDLVTDKEGSVIVTGNFTGGMFSLDAHNLFNHEPFDATDFFIAKFLSTPATDHTLTPLSGLKIFPIPTHGFILIDCEQIIQEIKITNLHGQVIYELRPETRQLNLELENEGVYFLSIRTGNRTETRKIIVQK